MAIIHELTLFFKIEIVSLIENEKNDLVNTNPPIWSGFIANLAN